jgi:ribosome-binding factor A
MKNNIKLILATAGDWITRNSNRNSLITLTRADTTADGKKLLIFYTVLPESQSVPAHEFLTRHGDDIRNYVKKKMKREPAWFRFIVDTGERNRERVSDLLDDTGETHGNIPERLHD